MEIVTVRGLKKYFGRGESQVKALDGIDLDIEKGKFTAIIGASGSGKTTLLKYDRRHGCAGRGGGDRGRRDPCRSEGKELAVFRRGKVGFVYQSFNLVPTLTVKENILFPLSPRGQYAGSGVFSGNRGSSSSAGAP